MKILVVDDHVLIRQAMHGMLRKLRRDAIVLEAPSSAKAMQVIADHPDVSLILLDLSLPDRDGFSVLADLRERMGADGPHSSLAARWDISQSPRKETSSSARFGW